MTDLSREELLRVMDFLKKVYGKHVVPTRRANEKMEQAFSQIRKLIQAKPTDWENADITQGEAKTMIQSLSNELAKKRKVSKELVEKWVIELDDEVDVGLNKMDEMKRILITMFKELGYEVEK